MDEQPASLGPASERGRPVEDSFGAHSPGRGDLESRIGLIVETADRSGHVIARERFDVVRPAGIVRQHEQLVQAVTKRLPDARIASAADGRVTFVWRGYRVTSAYDDVLER